MKDIQMRAAYSGSVAMLVVVSDFGELHVTDDEIKASGAVFSTRGKPLNLQARMVCDFAHHLMLDGWMEREHIHV